MIHDIQVSSICQNFIVTKKKEKMIKIRNLMMPTTASYFSRYKSISSYPFPLQIFHYHIRSHLWQIYMAIN